MVSNHGVHIFKGGELDEGFRVQLGGIREDDDAPCGRDEGGLDGGFFGVRGAEPERGVDTVGADKGDVRAEPGSGLDRGLADGGLGEAADAAAQDLEARCGGCRKGVRQWGWRG